MSASGGRVRFPENSGDTTLWSKRPEFERETYIHFNPFTGVMVVPYGEKHVAKIYPIDTERPGRDRKKDGEKEARILIDLKHENILRLIRTEIDYDSNRFVNFFPFYHSGSLKNALYIENSYKPTALTTDKKVRIGVCCQLLSALDFLHSKHILHLDFKPENVLWQPHATRVVLCDFDTSRENVSAPFKPSVRPRKTVRYAAYEMYTYDDIFTYTDMYSFGVVFFEIYFNILAFAGYREHNLDNLVFVMGNGKAVEQIGIPPNCPQFASLLLRRCLLCPAGPDRIKASRLNEVFMRIISSRVGSSIQETDLCGGLRETVSVDVKEFLDIELEEKGMVAESGEILSTDSGGSSSGGSEHRLSRGESENQVLASDSIHTSHVDEPPTSEFQSDAVDGCPPPPQEHTMNNDMCFDDPKESPDEFMMFESNHTPQPEVRFVVDRRESVAEDQPIKDSEAMDQQP